MHHSKGSKKRDKRVFILGAGITGLSAGYVSGLPIFEAKDVAGGICTSYYMKKNGGKRMFSPPKDGGAYHFEIGGGHWIFGGDPSIKRFINKLSPCTTYERKSSVYLPGTKTFVPYPLQNNLSKLDKKTSKKALDEMLGEKKVANKIVTMSDWLEASFGKTLCDIFFFPFHKLYTAGLYKDIAPQDGYKSPINKNDVLDGYNGKAKAVGYNSTFIYPKNGLDHLARKLAEKCDIKYNKHISKIDSVKKVIHFSDGKKEAYDELISTIPLNHMAKIAGIRETAKPYPSPAVLVVNIGAKRGKNCPKDEQWIYIPESKSGFHRVGFYDAVDAMFLPASNRRNKDRASIYVEMAFPEGSRPGKEELDKHCRNIIKELQEWKWIGDVEVYDPTWIETAYTWSWPGSDWKERTLKELESRGIYQIGRYGRWCFQGIADSVKDGLMIGGAFSS